MNEIIFGIPARRVAKKEALNYSAFIMQEAPVEKGKAFKMQFSDPAINTMGINIDEKPRVAVASLETNTYLVVVTDEVRDKIPDKDICTVYSDGSLSNKRLYIYLSKTFELNTSIKNTFVLERARVDSGVPGVEPIIMYKLIRQESLDQPQTSQGDQEPLMDRAPGEHPSTDEPPVIEDQPQGDGLGLR